MSELNGGPEVRKVALLVLPHASLLSVASTLDPLRCANRHLGREAIRWVVISPDRTSVPLTCGLSLPVQGDIAAAAGADVLIVIAGFRIGEVATAALIGKLKRVSHRVGVIGALDSGAWILAKAGLLDGHRATTHWEDLEDFAVRHPTVTVVPDRFVVSGNRMTAGGAAPAFDMMLSLVRQWHGGQIALEVANSFITTTVDPSEPQRRAPQDAGPDDPRVRAAINLMETGIEQRLRVADVADSVGLSVRRLEGVFRAAYGITPGAFFQDLRLQAAKRMLADTRHPLSVVAERCGFSSPSTFSRAFAKRFSESPRAFRERRAGFSGFGSAQGAESDQASGSLRTAPVAAEVANSA